MDSEAPLPDVLRLALEFLSPRGEGLAVTLYLVGPDSSLALDGFEVWLEEGPQVFHGVCIGTGETEEAALRDAQEELRRYTHEVASRLRRCNRLERGKTNAPSHR